MDCYTSNRCEGSLQDHTSVDIAKLRQALSFFDLPNSMCPTELRLAIKALKLREDRQRLAKRLLHDCVQVCALPLQPKHCCI